MTNDNKKNEIAAYQKWQNQTNGRHPDASPSTQVPLPAKSARSLIPVPDAIASLAGALAGQPWPSSSEAQIASVVGKR